MQRITCDELKNGFRYYAVYDKKANVSGVGVKHGSIYDPLGKAGLSEMIVRPKRGRAHFTEHVIFNCSTKYSAEEVERILWHRLGDLESGLHNTRTDHTSTFYGHNSLLKQAYMLECLDVFASLLRDRIIDSDYFLTEQAAVHQEYLERGEDSLEWFLYITLLASLYERNPIRNRIDCEKEDLKNMTVRDIRKIVAQYYVPQNMFLLVLGPSHKKTKRLAEEYFGDMEGKPPPPLEYDHGEDFPRLSSPREISPSRRGISQYHLVIGFPTEAYHSKDAEVIDVMSRILWKRIYEPLRYQNSDFEKGSYHPMVETQRTFVHGLLSIHFSSKSREFVEWGREEIFRELERLKSERVEDWELRIQRDFLDSQFVDAFQNSPNELAELIIGAVTNGDEDLEFLHGFRRRLSRVTRKKILEAANKYFSSPHVQMLISPAEQ